MSQTFTEGQNMSAYPLVTMHMTSSLNTIILSWLTANEGRKLFEWECYNEGK